MKMLPKVAMDVKYCEAKVFFLLTNKTTFHFYNKFLLKVIRFDYIFYTKMIYQVLLIMLYMAMNVLSNWSKAWVSDYTHTRSIDTRDGYGVTDKYKIDGYQS